MARLGYHNVSLAALSPAGALVFPPDFTVVTPFAPLSSLIYATTTAPENQVQMFIPRAAAQPSQSDKYRRPSGILFTNCINLTSFYS